MKAKKKGRSKRSTVFFTMTEANLRQMDKSAHPCPVIRKGDPSFSALSTPISDDESRTLANFKEQEEVQGGPNLDFPPRIFRQ
jgi:hypothetical protein